MVTNLDRAAAVSRHVQLESVSLKEAAFESFADPAAPAEELDAEFSYMATYQVREGSVLALVDFRLKATAKNGAEPSPVATLEATYVLVYSVPGDVSFEDDALVHFAALNGTYNAWPYWRELVHTVTGRAGLASLVIPVFRPPVQALDTPEDASTARRASKRSEKSTAKATKDPKAAGKKGKASAK